MLPGKLPDIPVFRTVEEILNGEDVFLNKGLTEIRDRMVRYE